jgi:hypothetical protein
MAYSSRTHIVEYYGGKGYAMSYLHKLSTCY